MKQKNMAYIPDVEEDIFLNQSSLSKECMEEIKEIDKHEIVVKISEIIGECPSNIRFAEKIFDDVRFEMTRYVIHHEYSRENAIKSGLLNWLDDRTDPANMDKLSDFCKKFLK